MWKHGMWRYSRIALFWMSNTQQIWIMRHLLYSLKTLYLPMPEWQNIIPSEKRKDTSVWYLNDLTYYKNTSNSPKYVGYQHHEKSEYSQTDPHNRPCPFHFFIATGNFSETRHSLEQKINIHVRILLFHHV
jgi:hypothetical protein